MSHADVAVDLQTYSWPLEAVSPLKYICRFLTTFNNYWLAVVSNLRKAWWDWARISWSFVLGGGRFPDLQQILQYSRPVEPLVWIIELGYEPQYWVDPWKIIPQGGPPFVCNTTTERSRGAVGVHAVGSVNGISGPRVGDKVRPLPPEQHCPVYCDQPNTGAVYGSGAAASSEGSMEMVGVGGYVIEGRNGSAAGDGNGGRGGGGEEMRKWIIRWDNESYM